MSTFKIKRYSLADEDYIKERKKNAKYALPVNILAGGTAGGLMGAAISSRKNIGTGALIGAGLGTGIGVLAGRSEKKKNLKELKKYQSASKEDRAYLRDKYERKKVRDAIITAGIIAH